MTDTTMRLHRRLRAPDSNSLHYREFELNLTNDKRHLILSRYTEFYCRERPGWDLVHHHQVPVASLIRWIISNSDAEKN
ncbi:hypothetical protein [Stutzerimonas stutzeri]|uniref:Uncharacterized protein n=1 Tax=Stutzerimonas stutzeri TaxID=316 RepID=A0A0D9ALH3_STUST|nr:hypothetical protein [Stutzerimonas stutzeri]KJH81890.1 hypothetical protein UF78_10940 [Stutzerimonas stutzeri]